MDKLEEFERIQDILSTRKNESIADFFSDDLNKLSEANILIATSPSDLGVCRNGGRRGSSFAPQSILSIVKKMASHSAPKSFVVAPVSDGLSEEKNFSTAQLESATALTRLYSDFNGKSILHIGGGHDHAYTMLKSLEFYNKKIKVINIDAHMDTRDDLHPHSGTPFRQFSSEAKVDYHLVELGVHNFVNSISTMKPLPRGEMQMITTKSLRSATKNFSENLELWLSENIPIDSDELVYLSLDCDAIDASRMEGVSAVNHDGIPLHAIKQIFSYVRHNTKVFISGIYEYNPVYDNLSQKGARALASLIYEEVLFPVS
ncbi:MAG: arginase family protein [Bacteriovoracaceae bacterium]|nr:arginase family protein [Bacteriovoracaceae bacterium]